jgi:hypothetical protein
MEAGYKDLNGNGVMDKNDSYGLSAGVGTFPEFMIYCNAPFTVINEEGYPEFAYTNNSEKLINTFDAIFNKLIVNPGCVVTEYDLGADYAGARNMFANNQFLYCFQAIGSLQSLRNDMESDFGVVPGPKLDEQQEKHYANGSMWASTYALPVSTENPERAGSILNAMAYFSVDTIQKKVIETVVLNRNLRDEESEQMVRMVIENKLYDRAFTLDMGGIFSTIYNIVSTETMTFASDMEKIQKVFERDVKKLIKAYKGED